MQTPSQSQDLKQSSYIFCELPESRVIEETELFSFILDAFPVTLGHSLINPKRHVETWFDCLEQEHVVNQLL
ncbi:MAG: HIT domain-containing protein [Kangiellaceae bacterium]|nr:HIT domain-containing protein [Kangiellaceae bacterium]